MRINPTQNKIRITATIILFFACVSFAFAKNQDAKSNVKKGTGGYESVVAPEQEKNLTDLQKEARSYRAQGLELQRAGDVGGAMSLYQKAIILDSLYAVPYNDLGIIFEASGDIDRAEECYLRCITIDPKYSSAYSNLALLYESVRDIGKAAQYWQKRVELGPPDDPWTLKAKQRLADIRLVLSDSPFEEAREQDVMALIQDISSRKATLRKDNKALAKDYFDKAKLNYKKGDETTALKLAIDASQLDPANKEIKEFIVKTETRLLSK